MSVEFDVYQEMKNELQARIAPLERELESLRDAGARIAAIQAKLQVLRAEHAEYDALLPKEQVADAGPVTNTPKFDR